MSKVEEPAREGFLYQVWLDRGFGTQILHTIDGRSVEIKEKGTRNYDAGPDFLDALILLDDQLLRGDIEIHPVAGDWFLHNHHRDARYNKVVLHVVTMNCPANFRTLCQSGALVPTLNLDAFLDVPAEQLEEEAMSEANHGCRVSGRCDLAMKTDAVIRKVLECAGDLRLGIKIQRFAEKRQTESWDQVFYEAVLEALGYAKNQVPFRNLAKTLPIAKIAKYVWNDPSELARTKCEAYLLGAAGLLPFQSAGRVLTEPELQQYVIEAERHWLDFPENKRTECLKAEAWQFFRLRPQNFPTRRIAGAAVIVMKFIGDGFVPVLRKALAQLEHQPQNANREIEKLFIVMSHGFWARHYCFDESSLEHSRQLRTDRHIVGPDRAKDIAVNVAIPAMIAYAEETDDGRLANLLREIYAHYPLIAENELTRSMRQQIFGMKDGGQNCVFGVRHQQGLIHLRKSVCKPGYCASCLSMNNG
jgi:hypothetical protein